RSAARHPLAHTKENQRITDRCHRTDLPGGRGECALGELGLPGEPDDLLVLAERRRAFDFEPARLGELAERGAAVRLFRVRERRFAGGVLRAFETEILDDLVVDFGKRFFASGLSLVDLDDVKTAARL